MTDATPDWGELRRLAEAARDDATPYRPFTMTAYRNATEPEHVLALLDRAEKAEAEVAETRKWVDEIVRERLDEINAEGEAFDKASANCLRNILRNLCGEAGEETINHPDGWNDDFAYECVAEEMRRRDRALEKAQAEAARLREALDAIKSLGRVDMRGCWEHELRDIIGSMTDGAARALTGGDHG